MTFNTFTVDNIRTLAILCEEHQLSAQQAALFQLLHRMNTQASGSVSAEEINSRGFCAMKLLPDQINADLRRAWGM